MAKQTKVMSLGCLVNPSCSANTPINLATSPTLKFSSARLLVAGLDGFLEVLQRGVQLRDGCLAVAFALRREVRSDLGLVGVQRALGPRHRLDAPRA